MDLSAINWENISLSLAAIAAVIALWRDNQKLREQAKVLQDDHKKDLREFHAQKVYELNARVMVMEDKLEIDRQDRFKYMPPVTQAERKATGNLDMKPDTIFSDEISASRKP